MLVIHGVDAVAAEEVIPRLDVVDRQTSLPGNMMPGVVEDVGLDQATGGPGINSITNAVTLIMMEHTMMNVEGTGVIYSVNAIALDLHCSMSPVPQLAVVNLKPGASLRPYPHQKRTSTISP